MACPAASLWDTAATLSGVSCDSAFALDSASPPLYERLGTGGAAEAVLQRLSTLFYERVYADTEPLPSGALLRHAFAATTKAEAAANQSAYLVERLGGPKIYTQSKGSVSLIGRHAPYAGVTHEAAARWLHHMDAALLRVPEIDDEARAMLRSFFAFHARYIVEGRLLLNPARLIGYGGSVHMASARSGGQTELREHE